MSAMRSASSSTTISRSATETSLRSIRSIMRPGVATTKSTPLASALIWRSMLAPP